jgi:hypothetical protein
VSLYSTDYFANTGPVITGQGFFTLSGQGQTFATPDWINVRDHVTGGIGTTGNPWTGWDTAINWATTNTTYYFPAGTYLAGISGFTLTGGRQWLIGDGPTATVLSYTPTADGTALVTFSSGTGVQGGVKMMSFNSSDTTHTKTMIRPIASQYMTFSDIASIDGGWTGNTSIGIQIQGTSKFIWIDRCLIAADKPVTIEGSLDWSHIWASELHSLSGSANHNVTVSDGVNLSDVTFRQVAGVLGAGFLKFLDTSATTAQINIMFDQVRHEQATTGTSFMIDMETTSGSSAFQNLTFNTVYGGLNINGIKLRKVNTTAVFNNFEYIDTAKTALDIDSTNSSGSFTFNGGSRVAGSIVSLALGVPMTATATNLINTTASTAVEGVELRGRMKSHQSTAPSIGTISAGIGATGTVACTAGSTDQAGSILLTWNGAGKTATVTFIMTFVTAYAAAPAVLLTASGGNIALTPPVSPTGVAVNTNNAQFSFTNGAIPADTNTLTLFYWVIPFAT